MKRLTLQPIGYVRNQVPRGEQVTWETVESLVVIEEKFSQALEGIEEFSHIIVVFWLQQIPFRGREGEERPQLKVRPEQREDMPLLGVLATRSPMRPNPIATTAVRLLKRHGNILTVRGLDAYHGTPVLDIKPYLPNGDSIPQAQVPDWVMRLRGRD